MNDTSHSRTPRDDGANDDSLLKALKTWMRSLRRKNGDSLRETLDELIEDRDDDEAPIDENERLLLSNILHLRDVTVYDAMVPRANIVAIDSETAVEELVYIFVREGHSRMPVYRETLDDVIGMVHIKDLLAASVASSLSEKPVQLSRIVRRVLFVSPSMRVLELMLEMRAKRTHMAMVVDEYGGIDGLVTIEDLVEEIVGEIDDEHDSEEDPEIRLLEAGLIEADARVPIEQFEQLSGLLLSDEEREDIDTLGGLVFFVAGRVPAKGEVVVHPAGFEFDILDADPRRIKRLRVRLPLSPEDAEAQNANRAQNSKPEDAA